MSMETYGLACVQIRLRKLALLSVGFGAFALFSSCSNEVALENQRQLQMQKAGLEEMHRELEEFRSAGQFSEWSNASVRYRRLRRADREQSLGTRSRADESRRL